MEARELSIPGAFEFNPRTFPDGRGVFVAPFQESAFLATVGYPLRVAQTNHSVSRRGALRGVHFADVPPGQAKYVYCPSGALLDVVIDIRVGSPTFGKWDAVILDSTEFKALYVSEGLGHAFIALKDDTIISYLCTTGYNPQAEHGIHPLDPALALPWPGDIEPLLSEKDLAAPTLAEAERSGPLPTYEDCRAHYEELRTAPQLPRIGRTERVVPHDEPAAVVGPDHPLDGQLPRPRRPDNHGDVPGCRCGTASHQHDVGVGQGRRHRGPAHPQPPPRPPAEWVPYPCQRSPPPARPTARG